MSSGFYQGNDPDVDSTSARAWAQTAQDWAIKLDGPVSGSDYSAQWHANAAANSASQAAVSAGESAAAAAAAQASADALNSLVLNDIVDVDVPIPNDGDVLTYVSATGNWEAVPAAVVVDASVRALWDKIAAFESRLGG